MHVSEQSIGIDTANLLHSSSLTSTTPTKPRDALLPLLFQPVWTAKHLQTLKVQQRSTISASVIIGKYHLPRDGNEDFEELATDISQATVDDILNFPTARDKFDLNIFCPVFSSLYKIAGLDSARSSHSYYIHAAKDAVRSIFDTLMPYANDDGSLRVDLHSFPFHLKRIGVRGVLHCDGCVIKTDLGGGASPLPVVTFSMTRPGGQEDIEAQEISQLLLQAALAHEQNSGREMHRTFVIRIDGTRMQLTSANISVSYLESLHQSKTCSEGFAVSRSQELDMLDIEGRKEVVRVLLGLLKSFGSRSVQRYI